MVEHPQAADEVEVAVREGERLRIARHERAALGSALSRGGEVVLRRVDADHVADERCEHIGQRAGPAADVERPLVTCKRGQQPPHPCLEVGVTLGLERSTPLDGIRHPITSLVARPGETRIPHASS